MPLGLAAFGNLLGILTSPGYIATYLTLTVSYSILFTRNNFTHTHFIVFPTAVVIEKRYLQTMKNALAHFATY